MIVNFALTLFKFVFNLKVHIHTHTNTYISMYYISVGSLNSHPTLVESSDETNKIAKIISFFSQ